MKKRLYFTLIILLISVTLCSGTAYAKTILYKIGAGDVVEISVWKDEYLTRQIVVPPDGVISFPLIGDIVVTNLSVPSLRAIVSRKIKEFVTDANVTVMLLNANSMKAFVVGKVNQPGQYPIDMETNVMQIIAMAGDLNAFASAGNIIILRKDQGKFIKLPFDYHDVKKGKHLEQNIILKKGDVVVVP